jgi:hypothetical protein
MRLLLLFILLISAIHVKAVNYFVNPSSDATEEKGTIDAPWKSFEPLHKAMPSFRAGDTIFLKRGELFFEKLNLKCNGNANAPIVFTAYGEGKDRPIFMYKPPISEKVKSEGFAIRIYKSSYVVFNSIDITDDHIDPNDHNVESLIKIAFAIDESNHIVISRCNVSRVGIGVNIVGNDNLVEHSSITNLRMVHNTQGGYDDYGANAIVLAGERNQILNNYFKDCWAYSFDFDYDGGAIEMFGPKSGNNRIIGNTVINCNGFMEFGSNEGGVNGNNLVSKNLVINCGDIIYINNDGPFSVKVEQLQLIENVVIQAIEQLTKPKHLISMAKLSADKEIIILKNNIFWLTIPVNIAKASQFAGTQLTHTGNVYYMGGGVLNFTADRSEKMLKKDSLQLRKSPFGEILSLNMDFFPFKYLLRYWFLIS